MKVFSGFGKEAEKILKRGGVGVIPTDTIYGLVGSAFSKRAVTLIYKLRKRRPDKPFIMLIGSLKDLRKFGVKVSEIESAALQKLWPGKVSIVLPCSAKKFSYLHHGTKTLAFRFPDKKNIRKLLKSTGPLVAPSANLEGQPPARTTREAQRYFGDKIDFYVDAGKISRKPSKIVKIDGGKVATLRL